MGFLQFDNTRELCSGELLAVKEDVCVIPALAIYWIT
jgi:hypothetical protein